MSALPIITEITDQGITARVEGDEVALSAPKGTLTPEVLAKLKARNLTFYVHLRNCRKGLNRIGRKYPNLRSN